MYVSYNKYVKCERPQFTPDVKYVLSLIVSSNDTWFSAEKNPFKSSPAMDNVIFPLLLEYPNFFNVTVL